MSICGAGQGRGGGGLRLYRGPHACRGSQHPARRAVSALFSASRIPLSDPVFFSGIPLFLSSQHHSVNNVERRRTPFRPISGTFLASLYRCFSPNFYGTLGRLRVLLMGLRGACLSCFLIFFYYFFILFLMKKSCVLRGEDSSSEYFVTGG